MVQKLDKQFDEISGSFVLIVERRDKTVAESCSIKNYFKVFFALFDPKFGPETINKSKFLIINGLNRYRFYLL